MLFGHLAQRRSVLPTVFGMAIFFLVLWNQAGTGTPERTTRFTRAPEMPADKLAPTDAARQRPPGVTAVPTAGEEAFGEDAKPAQLPTNTNAYRVMPAAGVKVFELEKASRSGESTGPEPAAVPIIEAVVSTAPSTTLGLAQAPDPAAAAVPKVDTYISTRVGTPVSTPDIGRVSVRLTATNESVWGWQNIKHALGVDIIAKLAGSSDTFKVQFKSKSSRSWTDKRLSQPLSAQRVAVLKHGYHTRTVLAIAPVLKPGVDIFKAAPVLLFFNGDMHRPQDELKLRVCGRWYDVRLNLKDGDWFGLKYSDQHVSVVDQHGVTTTFADGTQEASVSFAAIPEALLYAAGFETGQVVTLRNIVLDIELQSLDSNVTATAGSRGAVKFDTKGCAEVHPLARSRECSNRITEPRRATLQPGLAQIDLTTAQGCARLNDGGSCGQCKPGLELCPDQKRCVPAHLSRSLYCIACRKANGISAGQFARLRKELAAALTFERTSYVEEYFKSQSKMTPALTHVQCEAVSFMEPMLQAPFPHHTETRNFSVGIIQFVFEQSAARTLRRVRERKMLFGESADDWSALLLCV